MNSCAIPVVLLLGALLSASPAPDTRFDSVLDNPKVSVFSLRLPPGRLAHVYQNTHDLLWVALTYGRVTFSGRDRQDAAVDFRPGEARFVPSFGFSAITNDGAEPFRAILVEIKTRGLASSCDCDSVAQRVVCGCARAAALPPLWAVGIGSLVVGGTTLAPAQAFQAAGERGDTLMVAISKLSLSDDASGNSRIGLGAGEVRWFDRGLHKFRNTGSTPARYLTLEFGS